MNSITFSQCRVVSLIIVGAGRPPCDVAETMPGLSSQPKSGTVRSTNILSHAREVYNSYM